MCINRQKEILGCLLGTAVGDSLGLPYEGLRPCRAARLLGPPDRHRFIFGRGMVSDDTEHACFAARALIESRLDPIQFEQSLVRLLKWWLASVPAGVGKATAQAILKMWLGFAADKSGVFSAGNGPAMRSPLLGVVFAGHPERLKEFVKRSTRMTHSDPKAYWGALCAALAASISARQKPIAPQEFLSVVQESLKEEPAEEFITLLVGACHSAASSEPVLEFAKTIGCTKGVSGYIFHTIPCVVQVWLRHQQDFAAGIQEMIAAGGDTDTTAAILGAIIGAGVGVDGIPAAWIQGIWEWPRSVKWMTHLAAALDQTIAGNSVSVPGYCIPAIPIRNVIFLLIVLSHGLRRLLPPY